MLNFTWIVTNNKTKIRVEDECIVQYLKKEVVFKFVSLLIIIDGLFADQLPQHK